MAAVTLAGRVDDWPSRLAAVIERAGRTPYVLGEWDCFRFACEVIEALTGQPSRWPEFAGYRTRREALVAIARHGATFEDAGDWFFGCTRLDAEQVRRGDRVRRGDIVALQTPDGEKHLGVCVGWQAAYLAPDGLIFVPLREALCAWRVG